MTVKVTYTSILILLFYIFIRMLFIVKILIKRSIRTENKKIKKEYFAENAINVSNLLKSNAFWYKSYSTIIDG